MGDPSSRAKAIFLAALEGHTPEQWPAFVELACAGDSGLRAEVEKLLRARLALGSFHEMPRSDPCVPTGASVGTLLGPYRLLEPLGEGGMGTVYLAQQTAPVKRLVALKLVRPGMDSAQVVARFEAERQALALMDHPNIARVFDAGTTGTGRPYFVMELVRGVPLTNYCDGQRLTPRQRLELFVPVCQAIQHAHQKGIIHRDIKPSNVLVALYDGKPVPKVIDFGIAKATGQGLTEDTLLIGFESVVGTPEYMSPEQAELNNPDIDTRSDVYSLGVLLYELLTGTTPLDRKRLWEVGVLEVLRLIREGETPRPSTRLSGTEDLPSIAANRGLEPRKLSGLVRGELDWVVLKALEKDRSRRYESASAFAADVQRYLSDEPVLACPPSVGYRLRKFVRRNKGPVLAVSVITLLLVAGIVGTTAGLLRALDAAAVEAQARRQTRQALDTTVDAVLEDMLGRQVRLTAQHREFFRKVLEFQEAFAAARADDPEGLESRASAYFRVGRFRWLLGEYREAESAYRRAVALQRELVAAFLGRESFRSDLAGSQDNLAILLVETGRQKEAMDVHRDALAVRKKLVADVPDRPEFRRELARSHLNLGRLLAQAGRVREAETDYRAALALLQPLAGEFPNRSDYRENLAATYNNLANALHATGRVEEGKAAEATALAVQKRLADDFPGNPECRRVAALGHHNAASRLWDSGRLKEAEAAYRKALDLLRRLADEFPARPEFRQDLARSHIRLGRLLDRTGRLKEAEAATRDGLALLKQLATDLPTRPDFRHGLGASYDSLGILLAETGRLQEAEAAFGKARGLLGQLAKEFPSRPDFRQELAHSHGNLAKLLHTTGRPKEAEATRRGAVALQRRLAADFPDQPGFRGGLALSLNNLGFLLTEQKRYPEAEQLYHEALAIRERLAADFPDRPEFQHDLAFTWNSLGTLLRETDRPAKAEAAFRKALALSKRLAGRISTRPEFRQQLARVHNNLGLLLVEKKKDYTEAARHYAAALALHKRLAADLPTVAECQNDLATTLLNIAILHNHRAEFADAVALVEQARPHHQAALKGSPRDLTHRQSYHGSLRALAWGRYGLGDHVRLAATADDLAGFDHDPPNNVCHAARYLCLCVNLTGKDAQLDAARRTELARDYADRALALLREAAARDPREAARSRTRPEYRWQIALCYVDLGGLLAADRRPKEAEAAYRAALDLLKRLADDFPNRADLLRQLALCHHSLGAFLYDTRRPKEAEAPYRAALDRWKQLPKDFPNRATYLHESARSHTNLGNVLYITGRLKEAEAAYRDALPLQEQLVAEFRKVPDYRNALAGTLVSIAMVHSQRREFAAAVALLERARPHHQAALKADPRNHGYRQFYHNNLRTLAATYLGLADHARVATTADVLARFGHDPANEAYTAASFLCRCVGLAAEGARLDDAGRKELTQSYADRAMAMLQQAVAQGYKDAAHMRQNPDLEPLRAREEFRKLLANLEGKAKE